MLTRAVSRDHSWGGPGKVDTYLGDEGTEPEWLMEKHTVQDLWCTKHWLDLAPWLFIICQRLASKMLFSDAWTPSCAGTSDPAAGTQQLLCGRLPRPGAVCFFLLNFCFSYAPALKKQMFEVVCMM